MKLNFWGIDFEYTSNIWTWKNIKSTLLIYWYVIWRMFVFALPISGLLVLFGTVVSLKYFPVTLFEDFRSSTDIVSILANLNIYNIYLEHQRPWLIPSLFIIPLTFANIYLNYRALYRKQFKTFKLYGTSNIAFWSSYYWKRTTIFFGVSYIVFPPFIELPIAIQFIGWIALIAGSHICLHAKFWGVTLQERL